MEGKGLLLIISGFSGTGKGTVINRLLEKYDEKYALSISATTRSPREGEQDGREYFFKTREEFEEMIAKDELIEHACYVDNYYGTPKRYVEEKLEAGKNVILEIEIQGALDVKRLFPEAVLIFLLPPSVAELERRLRERGTETEEVVRARMERAAKEISSKFGCAVLLKGGHSLNDANDYLFDAKSGNDGIWFYGKKINNPNTHGTGCTLSSAIAANLAKGLSLSDAVKNAKDYISGALEAMLDLGKGSGPLAHNWNLK